MPPLRPMTASRPSIHEIASSILSPPSSTRPLCPSTHHRLRLSQPTSCPSPPAPHHAFHSSSRNLADRPTSNPKVKTISKSSSTSIKNNPNASSRNKASKAPESHDRGPASEEDTQTDFSILDVLGNMPAPSTSIDACLHDGFHLNSGVKVLGGAGALLVAGEVFEWRPWLANSQSPSSSSNTPSSASSEKLRILDDKGCFEVGEEAWGVLDVVWPKPDLLILGCGRGVVPVGKKTKRKLEGLGIRVDVLDTRNAAAQFNLLATERGVGTVAAALVPLGWREGRGCK